MTWKTRREFSAEYGMGDLIVKARQDHFGKLVVEIADVHQRDLVKISGKYDIDKLSGVLWGIVRDFEKGERGAEA